jgi:TolA-binding protein
MLKKIVLSVVFFSLAAGLSACTVMQSTYKKKVGEADAASKRLAALQEKHDVLVAENDGLKGRIDRLLSELEEMTLQKEKLTTDLAYVSDQRDKLASDKEELDLVRKMEDLASENDRLRRECAALEKPKE